MHAWERKREREIERERPLAPLFMFFSSPGACPMQIGLSQELCSTWSPHSGPETFLDLPLFYFRGLFPSLSFSHRHFGLLFPILTT